MTLPIWEMRPRNQSFNPYLAQIEHNREFLEVTEKTLLEVARTETAEERASLLARASYDATVLEKPWGVALLSILGAFFTVSVAVGVALLPISEHPGPLFLYALTIFLLILILLPCLVRTSRRQDRELALARARLTALHVAIAQTSATTESAARLIRRSPASVE